ncbi:hypothetical protein ALC62_10799 [Cyphomyrmex costatus]|uniref:IMD domain-containing protein n=1 Tax=Cyphomyrmex costatus TaxID=456900 RepID=A0A195CEE7_9HYME|nr:hypothetical protein ALC62_10799 [Cyphomyrmex costatus]
MSLICQGPVGETEIQGMPRRAFVSSRNETIKWRRLSTKRVSDASSRNILDKFNPGARQLINAGKAYLKALHGK